MKLPIFLLLAFSLFLISCSDDEPEVQEPEPLTKMVKLGQDGNLGQILTDEDGMTLYFFTLDASNGSNCAGPCLENWPPYYIEDLIIDDNLNVQDFGEIENSDGSKQTTYKDWPLYYFINDNNQGDVNGDGVNNVWYVAKPDYSLLLVNHQLTGHDGKSYKSDYSEGEEVVQYLVDDYGRTLYGFIRDRFNVNNFTKEDFSNDGAWPIFNSSSSGIASGLDQNLVGQIDVYGQQQITYNGWPLYYFGQDEMVRGNNKGISFPAPGVWPVITPGIQAAPDPENILLTENETLGSVLTDQNGMTLYFFSADSGNNSNCEGNCVGNWPVFYEPEVLPVNGLNLDDFSEIERNDGVMQTTYKGWPLYYFVNDNAPAETNGEGLNNVWYVAKPDYSVMLVNAQLIGHDGVEYLGDYTPGQEITQYLADPYGISIYGFINDTHDKNNFTKEDFSNNRVWPILEQDMLRFPSVMDPSLFNAIDVHGSSQLTYKGWPLYYFGQDEMMRGNNKGISFPAPGVWPVIPIDIESAPL